MKEACAFSLLILAISLAPIQSIADGQTADPMERSTGMGLPDFSKLDLKGNGHKQDSFSLVICEAAKLLGREADYETVYCLSSNAFAPAIDLGENCTAWWHVQGSQADEASYLRKAASVHQEGSQSHLDRAAASYERIVDLLTPATWAFYRNVLNDAAKQKAHAEIVLSPVRTELAAAADAMAKALDTMKGSAMTSKDKRQGNQAILDGLTHRGNWVSYMGTLVSCARFIDPDVSVAWLWGGSGYAFSLTVHEALCPSGPYMPVDELAHTLANTGFDLGALRVEANEEGFKKRVEELFGRTRKAIDAGMPVMGWSLDAIDWYPVHGYDGEGNYLFLRHNGQLGKYPHDKLGEKAPGGLALLNIVRKGSPPEDAAVVRDALSFAARMWRGGFTEEAYTSGLGGYDAWIGALEQTTDPPDDGTVFGHAFNAACWYECRRQAVAFLEEAEQRLSDSNLSSPFDKAITHYAVVADQFKTLTELFPCQPGQIAPMRERFQDADLRQKAIALLATARAAEAEGLESLAEIEAALASAMAGSGKQ